MLHLKDYFYDYPVTEQRLVVPFDVSYAAPQAHGIINIALHREYSPGTVFIFFQGRKGLYHI
jgi:hypothetical protein